MIKKLRRQFVFIIMGLVSVILLAVFAGICLYFSATLQDESYKTLQSALEKPPGEHSPKFEIGGRIPEGFRRDPVFVVSISGTGAVALVSSDHVEVDESILEQIAARVLAGGNERGELKEYSLRYLVGGRPGETKIAFTDLSLEKEQLHSVVLVTGLSVAGAFVVFLAASVLLARWVLRPVESAWQRQRRFVADASHELKTPLTVILAGVGILKSHPGESVQSQMQWVDGTEQEARRMKGLVDDLLFLAKEDDEEARLPTGPVCLSDAAATTALAFEPVAYEQGLAVDMNIEPDIRVLGNEGQLKQLVEILLDNAVKYAAGGSAVWLRLKKSQGQAELSVHNQGAPIPPEDQKHLFERFYRADPSRTKEGYGLGLSIAGAIVEGHRGKIRVESDKKETVFTVTLPLL